MVFYHGSTNHLPVGTILTGRKSHYHAEWSPTGFYEILERYRPSSMLAHQDAVFMCDNPDDIDAAGGGTDWVFHLRPLSTIERHDMNWSSQISCALDDQEQEENLQRYAQSYWAGIPFDNGESLWEYLTSKAEIIQVDKF